MALILPPLLGFRGPGRAPVITTGGGTTDPGFVDQPIATVNSTGDVTIKGKVKAGSFGKFVLPLAAVAADRKYTFRYTPRFQRLAQQGKLAMVGFGVKANNDFHIVGLRGDGSTGLHKYQVSGTPPNGWNASTGHTVNDGGAAAAGTQAGPNYIRLTTSSDGATYKFQSSADGASWSTEFTGQTPSPFSNVSGVSLFGMALWFNNSDAGEFDIAIDQFADAAAAPLANPTTWNPSDKSANCTLSNGNKTAVCGTAGGALSGLKAVAGKTSDKYYGEFTISGSVGNNMTLGIANASAPNTAFGINVNSLAWFGGGGVFRNGSQVGTDGTGSSGVVVSMAVDRDNNRIWFRVNGGIWNNNAANDPATNTGGIDISGVSGTIFPAWNGFNASDTNVANFGSADFAYAVPSGFTPGWPA